MARYLPDTSAWNRSRATEEIGARWRLLLARRHLAICPPVALELLYAARKADYEGLASDLTGLPQLPLDGRTASVAARTQAALVKEGQHRGPKPIDLLIAAIAEVHDAILLHYDRHFDLIAAATGQPAEWLAKPGSLA